MRVRIGDICTTFSGFTPAAADLFQVGKYPYFKVAEMNREANLRVMTETDSYVRESRKFFPKGAIVFPKNGAAIATNKKRILGQDSIVDLNTGGVKANEDIVDTNYLYYLFQNIDFSQFMRRGAVPTLDLKSILALEIELPTIPDQHRIVKELDLLSGIVEKKNAQLKIMGDLEQSVFYEMFDQPDSSSFPVFKLSQLSRQKLSYGSGASAVEFNGNVRYVRITDIQEDGTLTENSMSPDSYDEKYLLHEGDILFARSGATVGKTFLYNKQDGKSIYAGYLIRFVPDVSVVYPEYIYHFTRSQYYKAFVRANAQAVAQPNINAQQYGNLEICVPPMSLQKDFVERIMSIDSQKATIRRSIKVAQNLLASRLDNYFNV